MNAHVILLSCLQVTLHVAFVLLQFFSQTEAQLLLTLLKPLQRGQIESVLLGAGGVPYRHTGSSSLRPSLGSLEPTPYGPSFGPHNAISTVYP